MNGIRFNAFANLACALRQVTQESKRPYFPQLIWADQICINQSDLVERSHQVGFMRDIYNSARFVLVCLGGDQHLGREQAAALAGESEEDGDLEDQAFTEVDEAFTEIDEMIFSTGCELFGPIFDNPWWQRGWICQEVIAAKEVLILYCGLMVDWQTLSLIRDELHHNSQARITRIAQVEWNEDIAILARDRFCLPMVAKSGANFLMHGRKALTEAKKDDAIRVFSHAQTCSVTDPRDRIFAFVGLLDPGYAIIPDYNLDEATVLRYACKRIILYENGLNILTCCNYGSNRPQGIPSWTPTWSDSDNGPPLPVSFIYDAELDYPPFRASAGLHADAVFGSHNASSDSVLIVQCLFIDSLAMQDSIGPMPSLEFHENDILEWRRMVGLKHKPEDIGYSGCVAWRGRDTDGCCGSKEEFLRVMQNSRFDTEGYGRFFRSPKGYVGVAKGVADLRTTDLICILHGANTPLILRKVEGFYMLVSDAYVEGLMYGEAIDYMVDTDLVFETIQIY